MGLIPLRLIGVKRVFLWLGEGFKLGKGDRRMRKVGLRVGMECEDGGVTTYFPVTSVKQEEGSI